eukprot:scaffold21593_cov38-Phaeocystis_antarctica.AAC.3
MARARCHLLIAPATYPTCSLDPLAHVSHSHTHSLQAAIKATDLARRAVGLPAISLAGPEGHWQ